MLTLSEAVGREKQGADDNSLSPRHHRPMKVYTLNWTERGRELMIIAARLKTNSELENVLTALV